MNKQLFLIIFFFLLNLTFAFISIISVDPVIKNFFKILQYIVLVMQIIILFIIIKNY